MPHSAHSEQHPQEPGRFFLLTMPLAATHTTNPTAAIIIRISYHCIIDPPFFALVIPDSNRYTHCKYGNENE